MNELLNKLNANGLIDKYGDIILDSGQTVSKDTFNIFFGDVATNPTYVALSGSHTFLWGDPSETLTRTATELGYQKYFDEWKTKGII